MSQQSKGIGFSIGIFLGIGLLIGLIMHMMAPVLEGHKRDDMSEAAVAERIKPVGEVNTGAPIVQAAPVAAAPAGPRSGEAVFNTSCTACHSTGAAGAPRLGDKAAWAPRIATGLDALVNTAVKGRGAMPPRGTCGDCSDAELKKAVEYMVGKSR